jgi:hypothetical protein
VEWRDRLPGMLETRTVAAAGRVAQQGRKKGHAAGVRTTTLTSPGLLDRIAAVLDIALRNRPFQLSFRLALRQLYVCS